MTRPPLCFVLMPFGRKPDAAGVMIDFDAVYREIIAPAIADAGLEPIRADEETTGGIIHKPMFERLVLCEFAVADLTSANANVFYELGVRHAARPFATVQIFAGCSRLPFDVALLRALPYQLDEHGKPTNVPAARAALAEQLRIARESGAKDSPLFQLLEGYPEIQADKTDIFRDRVDYAAGVKQRLESARRVGRSAVATVEQELGSLTGQDTGVLIDLLLSYRAVKGWDDMIHLADRMPQPVAETVLVQEQLAFALNRAGRGDDAERVLLQLLDRKGPSSETLGLLGRVYKDRWEAAAREGNTFLARGLLRKAIDAYRRGFEADWRDAYPGVNAVTLMEVAEPPDPERTALVPVVRYAVQRRIATGRPDYWDHATLLELAVLAQDEEGAATVLGDALAAVRETWEPESTARNLRLIREAREGRGQPVAWAVEVEEALQRAARPALPPIVPPEPV
jgi:tetratricopeptide (TPR) repeat protein